MGPGSQLQNLANAKHFTISQFDTTFSVRRYPFHGTARCQAITYHVLVCVVHAPCAVPLPPEPTAERVSRARVARRAAPLEIRSGTSHVSLPSITTQTVQMVEGNVYIMGVLDAFFVMPYQVELLFVMHCQVE